METACDSWHSEAGSLHSESRSKRVAAASKQIVRDSKSLYAEIPAFVAAAKSFSDILDKIGDKSIEFDRAIKGKGEAKVQAEDELVEGTMPVGAALWAYAVATDDQEMAARAKINDSMLRRLRDTDLLAKAKSVHGEALTKVAGLADYGITQIMLDDLGGKIEAYSEALGRRESSVAERSGARQALSELFTRADTVLEKIDAMMELMHTKATQFYNEYFAARVIKDTGIRHRPEKPAPGQTETK